MVLYKASLMCEDYKENKRKEKTKGGREEGRKGWQKGRK